MNIELKKWDEAYFADIGEIFTHCDRSYLSDALPMPYTAEHARGWYESAVLPREGKDGLYRIICADGTPAGIITLTCGSDVFHPDAELGYMLLDAYSGRGIMTEAVGMVCEEAFAQLDILRISARVFSPNTASIRVLEKNGFVCEGRMPRAVNKGGEIYDLLHYGKLK